MAIANMKLSLEPGTRFGRYEVVTEIAAGGMATVFLARALGAAGFQRLVAIKLMHPHHANDPEFVTMFMDEARLAARIRHPNVVATLDLQNDEDGLYLVMEYIEGDGLIGLLRSAHKTEEPVPIPIAIRIALDTLSGLHAAHELTDDRGEPLRLVHRDVSPHNILVGSDGVSRITDFGIVRAEARLGGTRDGQVKGKLAYMAPEQTTAGPIDRRADIFAAGIVLWETLTAQRLFQGESDGATLRALLVNAIPTARSVRKDLPPEIDAVVTRALERDPEKRFSTAGTFADALEEAGGASGIASARAVAQYVRKIAGVKIAQVREKVSGHSAVDQSGPTSAVRRRKEGTDPERTVRREEGVFPVQTSSSPPTKVEGKAKFGTDPSARARPGASPIISSESIDDALSPDDLEPVARSRGPLWIVGAIVLAGLLAGGVHLAMRSSGDSGRVTASPATGGAARHSRGSGRGASESAPRTDRTAEVRHDESQTAAGSGTQAGDASTESPGGSANGASTGVSATVNPAASANGSQPSSTVRSPSSTPTRPRGTRRTQGGRRGGGVGYDPESI